MKLIPFFDAENLWTAPIARRFESQGQPVPDSVYDVFLKMRASTMVLAFSQGYLVQMSDWWAKWKFNTGFKYAPGSAMCESGTKVLIGHIHESLMPFRGVGPVPRETLEAAKEQGVAVPEERLGDFTPGAAELRVVIPGGVSLNGVTDGGHDIPGLTLHEPDGRLRAVVFEWQNEQWLDWDEAVAKSVELRHYID